MDIFSTSYGSYLKMQSDYEYFFLIQHRVGKKIQIHDILVENRCLNPLNLTQVDVIN